MTETASFVYDINAMNQLKNDLNGVQKAAENSLKDAKQNLCLARIALETAQYNYQKAMIEYERQLKEYEKAVVEYQKALESYEQAMAAYRKAMTNYKPPQRPNPCPGNWNPPPPPSPPTAPTPPGDPPTMPSDASLRAAEAACTAAEAAVTQVQQDFDSIGVLIQQLQTICNTVESTDKDAVHILTNAFFNLSVFNGMQSTGNFVADAIVTNAKVVQDGYDYVVTSTGEKLYLDIFSDEKLTMPQCQKLGKQIGVNALVALMQQQGYGTEAAYYAANTVDDTVTMAQVRELTARISGVSNSQSPIHTDNSAYAEVSKAMSNIPEDKMYIDGVKVEKTVLPVSLEDGYISSSYKMRDDVLHGGVDIARNNMVDTNVPVNAFISGTVYTTGFNAGGYGNYVVIKGNDGNYYYYAHLQGTPAVSQGSTVNAGDNLGIMGDSGSATGVHLHFEVRQGGNDKSKRIDPMSVPEIAELFKDYRVTG